MSGIHAGYTVAVTHSPNNAGVGDWRERMAAQGRVFPAYAVDVADYDSCQACVGKIANQIGSFFEAMPDREEAVSDIAEHIKRFWEPRMRRTLLGHVDAEAGSGLLEIVQEAQGRHRTMLE